MVVLAGLALAFWSALIGPRTVTAAPANTPAAASAPVVAPPLASQQASAATDFDGRLREVEAAEADTDFARAIRLCQAMITDFKTGDQLKTLGEALRRLTDGKKTASKLAFAVQKLAASDVQARQAGAQVLEDEGDLGVIFLRHAFRTKEEPIAREAGRLLAKMGDTGSIPLFLDKLMADPRSPLAEVASQGLVLMVHTMDKSVVASCFGLVQSDKGFVMARVVDVLEAVFLRECKRDEKAFNEAAGHPNAANVLRDYFSTALLSTNPAVAGWACERVLDMLPMREGFRVRYYPNTEFKGVAVDRLESAVRLDLDRSLRTGGRSNDLSVRWTSDVLVRQAGDHTVGLQASRDLPRTIQLWVDDKLVLEGVHDVSAPLTLETGWHKLRIDYVKQTGGINVGDIGFSWAGPKVEGVQVAQGPAVAFMHGPWPEEVAAMARAAADLGARDYPVVKAARQRLAEAASLGRVFLLNAIRYGAAPEAAAAATFLGGTQDKDAPPLLLARLKQEKDAAAIAALTDALGELVGAIDPKAFPEMFREALADGAGEMNPYASILCAALWRTCGSDAKKFGGLVGNPEGHAKLDAHVKAALASKDQAAMARACRTGYPFAPLLLGLRGRYYKDPNFVDLGAERLDSQITVANRRFPLPTNRQDNISAEWSGILVIEKTGDYAFAPEARSSAAFFVDGIPVSVKMSLTSGVHTIRGSFVQNQPGAESRVSLGWSGRGIQGQQPVTGALRGAPWDGKLAELGKAVADLAAVDPAKAGGARETLVNAGEVGRVYLRNGVRHGTAAAAAAAAALLAEYLDKPAVAPMLARFAGEKDASLSTALAGALCEMAGEIDSKALTDLYRTALAEGAAVMNPRVRILCAALVACGGSPEAFNKLVNTPNGYASLQKHVQAALASASPETVRTACRYGAPFAPALPGFIGRYYLGQDFRDLALEKLDPQVNVPNRQFPYPDKRQDNISARWTGLLRIEKPGDYTFIVNAQGGANVWVDNRHVAASAQSGEQKKDAVTLSPGLHKVRVDMWQASGNNQVQLQWVPPGGTRDWIPSGLLVSAPAEAVLAEVEKAVAGLSSAKPEEVGVAAEVLTRHGALSLFFLGRA
ncbi:MAG: PA14 domain-containing protein, partial [bacterium]